MPTLRFPEAGEGSSREPDSFSFPGRRIGVTLDEPDRRKKAGERADISSTSEVLDAMENVSRRMKDLARALDCFGFFDDDDDRPRAA